jgi:hypothetical protein
MWLILLISLQVHLAGACQWVCWKHFSSITVVLVFTISTQIILLNFISTLKLYPTFL